jgi:glutamyl-tRNA synthetase
MLTRLAPSPTGALHLGNARTFLATWLLARRHGWRVTLRVEDLDGPRVRAGAAEAVVDDLRWLGLDWDDGPLLQSARAAAHRAAVDRLLRQGDAYPCVCTRKEVDSAASAPHDEDGAAVYPGTCRGRFASVDAAARHAGRPPAIRFRVPPGPVNWNDGFAGPQRYADVASQLGDFVIAKADGTAAYQLAVVVDDAAAGVTEVVRGDDLLDSTPRQVLLYRALDLTSAIPNYTHLPLVVGPDGRRLAKRHGDSRLRAYRARGVPAGRVRQLLAGWLGITAAPDVTAVDLLASFDPHRVPRDQIVYTPADEAALVSNDRV